MKKGFTLIELLAVIVILAIIALIATPIVVNIINDTKKESQQRSIDLYMDAVQKRITQENMKVKYDPERCDIQDNGNVKCYSKEEIIKTSTGEEELKIEMNGKKPEKGTITFKTSSTEGNNTNNNKITYSRVVLEGMEYTSGKPPKVYIPPTPATDEDYRGYYADVDGDGEADGIIYADLKQTVSGQWNTVSSTYSYTAQTGLKEYTISKEKYTEGKFGEKEIISLKKGSSGTSRFYVMALEDFTEGSMTGDKSGRYSWYTNADNKMPNPPKDTSTDFGTGYTNTENMIRIWDNNGVKEGWTSGATQDNYDIWKHIKGEFAKGWYIPSRGEWAAFADYFTNNSKVETKLTTNNYNSTFGLSKYYWSSSEYSAGNAWNADFNMWYVNDTNVRVNLYVRLGATF